MAFETGYAAAWPFGPAVFCLVELLLWEGAYQQAQTFKLFRVQYSIEQLEEIVDRHKFALGDVAQIGSGRQKNGRRKLGQKMIGQIEIKIETSEVPCFLLLDFIDMKLRKDHSTFGMIGVREREKS